MIEESTRYLQYISVAVDTSNGTLLTVILHNCIHSKTNIENIRPPVFVHLRILGKLERGIHGESLPSHVRYLSKTSLIYPSVQRQGSNTCILFIHVLV